MSIPQNHIAMYSTLRDTGNSNTVKTRNVTVLQHTHDKTVTKLLSFILYYRKGLT